MLIVDQKRVVCQAPVRDDEVAIENVWRDLKPLLHLNQKGLPRAYATLCDWARAPYVAEPLAPAQLPLNSYFKKHATVDQLAAALRGNVQTRARLRQQDDMAAKVLEQLPFYQSFVLDGLMQELHAFIHSQGYVTELMAEPYYGPVADVDWRGSWPEVHARLQQAAPLERLYKQVAALHRLFRVMSFIEGERAGAAVPDHYHDMRTDKWTIDEDHPVIRTLREHKVPLWAGLSGTTRYMLLMARSLGCTNIARLTAFTHCIVAFFNFMPTVQSASHTSSEVILAARLLDKRIARKSASVSDGLTRVGPEAFGAAL